MLWYYFSWRLVLGFTIQNNPWDSEQHEHVEMLTGMQSSMFKHIAPARAASAPNWGCNSQLKHQQLTAQQAWRPFFLSALALAFLLLLPLLFPPWRNTREVQHAGAAASIGASPGDNFGQTQGTKVKEMKQWENCQRYPNAWRSRQAQCGNTKASMHVSFVDDFLCENL